MGPVRLTVADHDRARDFYRDAIGLSELDPSNGAVRMGTGDASDTPVVELVGDPDAPPRPRGTSGLFHHGLSHHAGPWRGCRRNSACCT